MNQEIFLHDVYEKEVERYGNRSIGSFLRMVSAEMPSTSDQIIWTEQGRLHTRYVNVLPQGTAAALPAVGAAAVIAADANAGGRLNFTIPAKPLPPFPDEVAPAAEAPPPPVP